MSDQQLKEMICCECYQYIDIDSIPAALKTGCTIKEPVDCGDVILMKLPKNLVTPHNCPDGVNERITLREVK